MGDFPGERIAVICYGTVNTLAGVSFTFMRYYAFYLAKLVDERIDRSLLKSAMLKSALNPIFNVNCRITGFRRYPAFHCSLHHSPTAVLHSKQAGN